MDMEPSFNLSPAVRAILGHMATVAFTAVGRKKRFRLLMQHVLPSEPLYAPACAKISTTIIADAHFWQTG